MQLLCGLPEPEAPVHGRLLGQAGGLGQGGGALHSCSGLSCYCLM
jgi:hypothetical protein